MTEGRVATAGSVPRAFCGPASPLDFTGPVVQPDRNLDSSHDLDDGFLRGPTSPLFLALLQPHDAPRVVARGLRQQDRAKATEVGPPACLAHVAIRGDLLVEQEGDEIGDLHEVGFGRIAEARMLDDAVDRQVPVAGAELDLRLTRSTPATSTSRHLRHPVARCGGRHTLAS